METIQTFLKSKSIEVQIKKICKRGKEGKIKPKKKE
jgi:hypothetical protein